MPVVLFPGTLTLSSSPLLSKPTMKYYHTCFKHETIFQRVIWVKIHLLPTGSEEREVLGVGSIPVAILPSCQDMKTIAL